MIYYTHARILIINEKMSEEKYTANNYFHIFIEPSIDE